MQRFVFRVLSFKEACGGMNITVSVINKHEKKDAYKIKPATAKVNGPTRKHDTPKGAALLGERTTARTAAFTDMCINLPCQKKN